MSKYISEFTELMKEWDFEKNNKLKLNPDQITHGSHKKAHWICSKNHQWYTYIQTRSKGHNCPFCAGQKVDKNKSLLKTNSFLAKEWDYDLNAKLNLFCDNILPKSGKKAHWICHKDKSHKWKIMIAHRSNGRGCPFCAGKKINNSNSLFTKRPNLKRIWDFEANNKIGLYGNKIALKSNKKAHWICSKNHKWKSTIINITNGSGCPFCSNKKINSQNNLFFLKPNIKAEWDFQENNKIGLYGDNISINSGKRANWICLKNINHKWSSTVHNKVGKNTQCPLCCKHVSKKETAWLNLLNINNKYRQLSLQGLNKIIVDGFDPKTNTIYEFYGDFWHGHPTRYDPKKLNTVSKKTFGELYKKTMDRENLIKQAGYTIITIWESDWDKLANSSST